MNDTNRKRLGLVAHSKLIGLIDCIDNPRANRRTKKLQAEDREALATWDKGAQDHGWKDAREWLAAGPHKPTAEEMEAEFRKLPPEIQAAREEMKRRFVAAMKDAGLTRADIAMP